MSPLARAAGAAAAALALLAAPAASRAELAPAKLKYVQLDASFDSAVTGGEETALFFESFELVGEPGCVLVRYSGELIGTDGDADLHAAASFKVYIGEVEVEPYPRVHETTTSILPQIVSFTAFACGVAGGPSGVLVTMKPVDPDDVVATIFRTLEVWAERPIAAAPLLTAARTPKPPLPPTVLKAKRVLLAASEDTVTARVDPVSVFHERVRLTGKRPSCLLVRFSAELRGDDVDANGFVHVSFRVRIGAEVPPHPNLVDLTPSEEPQIVTFSAYRCGLEPDTYEIDVEVESHDDDDPVEIRSRALQVFTDTGQPAPALE